jgi:hypothetical protein
MNMNMSMISTGLASALRAVALCGLCLAASPSFASWDGAVAGTIAQIDVTDGQNFGFRVTLSSGPVMCTGGATWAYLNEADSNYKVYIATLLLAKAAGKQVTLYTTNNGVYCHIGHIGTA